MMIYNGQTHKGLPVYVIREERKSKKGGFIGGFAVLLVLLLLFLPILYHLWEKFTEKETAPPEEKPKQKTFGLDNRSYEDLTGEPFLGLPPDEI